MSEEPHAAWADWSTPSDVQIGVFEDGNFVLAESQKKSNDKPAGLKQLSIVFWNSFNAQTCRKLSRPPRGARTTGGSR